MRQLATFDSELADFVGKLLRWDAMDRMSAEEACRHPFVTRGLPWGFGYVGGGVSSDTHMKSKHTTNVPTTTTLAGWARAAPARGTAAPM